MRWKTPLLFLSALLMIEIILYKIINWNTALQSIQLFLSQFHLPYNTVIVLLATGILGMVSGVVGSFAVLRRRALVGDATAHAALPGLCIAYLVLGYRNFAGLLLGALITGLLSVFFISWLRNNTRIKDDTAIGLVLSVFFGLGIALSRIIQNDPSGRQAGLDSYLLGKTAGIISQDLLFIIVIAINVLIILMIFIKEFQLLSFDPDFASVQGWPRIYLDFLLMSLLVVTTVIGLPAVGVVLMVAMLIIPGVSARFWTNRLNWMLFLAGIIGLITGLVGTWASSKYSDLPAGPVIVLTGTLICLFSMLFAPRRGILARVYEHLMLQKKVAQQNLLRTMYEITEPSLPERPPVSFEKLLHARSWNKAKLKYLLLSAIKREEIADLGNDKFSLTERGLKRSAEVVRSHRLWEIFLVEQADIASDHVDRDADLIEHILTPEIIFQLEEKLHQEGRWPVAAVPISVHKIA